MTDKSPVVLCIDDDPDILTYLQTVLEAEGYAFTGAGSAEEGLRLYDEVEPDVIIVDLMMEEVDSGTGFVKDLRLRSSPPPVFLLSSVGDNLSQTTDYAALGLAGVFQKPLNRKQLLSLLKAKLTV